MLETPKRSYPIDLAIVLLVSSLVFMVQLGNSRFWDQDEGYYAGTAAEMYAANDWIVPTFNGQLFAHKPPMMFWGMMLGYHLFGVNELGARFVSGLFGVANALLIYWIGKRLFDARTGLYASIALSSCLMFSVVTRSATADSHLTFFVMLAIWFWAREAIKALDSNASWQGWALAYVAMALAVLTKGPIGYFFPMAIIGLYMLMQIEPRVISTTSSIARWWRILEPFGPVNFIGTVWKMRPITGLIILSCIAGPWYALVQWKTNGQFLSEFLGVHNFGRFANSMDNHSGSIFYYVIACLVGLYPWTAFAVPSGISWLQTLRTPAMRRPAILISCWAGVYLVIFSLASTKLPNYVMPAYPALALVLGRAVALWIERPLEIPRRWIMTGWSLMSVVGIFIVGAIPMLSYLLREQPTLLQSIEIDPTLIANLNVISLVGIPLVFGGVCGLVCFAMRRERWAAATMSAISTAMLIVFWQCVVPVVDRMQTPQSLATHLREQFSDGQPLQLAVYGYFRPSMVFYSQGRIKFLDPPRSDHTALESLNDRSIGTIDPETIVVTTEELYPQLEGHLPANMKILERVAKFPERGELIILGDGERIRR